MGREGCGSRGLWVDGCGSRVVGRGGYEDNQ